MPPDRAIDLAVALANPHRASCHTLRVTACVHWGQRPHECMTRFVTRTEVVLCLQRCSVRPLVALLAARDGSVHAIVQPSNPLLDGSTARGPVRALAQRSW
jgi:hypothetical protein